MKKQLIRIKPPKRKPKRGFGPQPKPQGTQYFAIELNKEELSIVNGEYDLDYPEDIDLLELHHVSVLPVPVEAKNDRRCLEQWVNAIADERISYGKFLAEIYTNSLNDHAIKIGANVARIYYNSCLGDTRLRENSISHIFVPDFHEELPSQTTLIMQKYVVIERIVDGSLVTLKNRLGSFVA